MDVKETKLEIIQHILMIQKPEMLDKIHRFIHNMDVEEEEEKSGPSTKKVPSRANVIGSKIKGMLDMYK